VHKTLSAWYAVKLLQIYPYPNSRTSWPGKSMFGSCLQATTYALSTAQCRSSGMTSNRLYYSSPYHRRLRQMKLMFLFFPAGDEQIFFMLSCHSSRMVMRKHSCFQVVSRDDDKPGAWVVRMDRCSCQTTWCSPHEPDVDKINSGVFSS
jgi:hypothetical protein